MNKTTLIALMLVAGMGLQTVLASELFIQIINPQTGEVMLIPDGSCPTDPDCPPPIQELEPEEDEADNG